MRLVRDNVERVVVDEATALLLKAQGFREIEDSEAVEEAMATDTAKTDLASLKVDQLREIANEKGIAGAGSLTKAALLELLEGHGEDDGT